MTSSPEGWLLLTYTDTTTELVMSKTSLNGPEVVEGHAE